MNLDKTNLLITTDGFSTPIFQSLADLIYVQLRGEANANTPLAQIRYITPQGQDCLFQTVAAQPVGDSFTCSFDFDPISLSVYQNAVSFQIILGGFSCITHFSLIESTESEHVVSDGESMVFRDRDGIKKVPVLQSDKQTTLCVPTVPKKALFVGNSLVFGMHMTFGMCASSAQKDYFHHVTQAIRSVSPECTFSKLHGSPFEHASNVEEFEAWWDTEANAHTQKPAKCSFTEDLDLIILQMGDNINTEDKFNTFLYTGPELLRRIKQRCPRARIIWVHGWYHGLKNSKPILHVCKSWGIESVYIRDVRSDETQSSSGSKYIAPDGTVQTVKDTWITHPGDTGMALIAQKIITKLDL